MQEPLTIDERVQQVLKENPPAYMFKVFRWYKPHTQRIAKLFEDAGYRIVSINGYDEYNYINIQRVIRTDGV